VPLKRKAKGAAAPKLAAARGDGSSGVGDGCAGLQARARRSDTTGSVALDFVRLCWGGQSARCARACESELRRALHKGYEFFELKILAVSTVAPLTRHTQERPLEPLLEISQREKTERAHLECNISYKSY
jgi:hypothetical protein